MPCQAMGPSTTFARCAGGVASLSAANDTSAGGPCPSAAFVAIAGGNVVGLGNIFAAFAAGSMDHPAAVAPAAAASAIVSADGIAHPCAFIIWEVEGAGYIASAAIGRAERTGGVVAAAAAAVVGGIGRPAAAALAAAVLRRGCPVRPAAVSAGEGEFAGGASAPTVTHVEVIVPGGGAFDPPLCHSPCRLARRGPCGRYGQEGGNLRCSNAALPPAPLASAQVALRPTLSLDWEGSVCRGAWSWCAHTEGHGVDGGERGGGADMRIGVNALGGGEGGWRVVGAEVVGARGTDRDLFLVNCLEVLSPACPGPSWVAAGETLWGDSASLFSW
ncbi:hypothetical protein BDK51DRAFT_37523 [Blyttiomyces helicus]|uniref:Uncharacterized protein n=1 Tax=Blyttiomyces helicus TaxID=388810 RepID=A0A4P9WK89_9FUNG|nr:hypothetical protein BDK51DRAFT_37523 [Blyttiomyces helicus]|eukprot:RKO91570.1 hypothetical protein BDK51DRAFT_37523 [Blyttiomyces helicus]